MIETSWARIEGWMQLHAPEAFAALRGGASTERIDTAEQSLGLELSDPFRRSVSQHDGQEQRWPSLVEFGFLMPLEAIVEAVRSNERYGIDEVELEDAVWWRRGWVPFVSRDGDYISLALGSSWQRNVGEVWCFQHDMEPIHSLIAPDFATWLARWAGELEAGVFYLDRAAGAGLLPHPGQVSRLWPADAGQ